MVTKSELKKLILAAVEKGDCDLLRSLHSQAPDVFKLAIETHGFQQSFMYDVQWMLPEVLALLIDLGVDINRHENEGYAPDGGFPLNFCIIRNNRERARLLLEYGADPDLCCALHGVARMDAAPEDQIGMCQLLIDFGADPNHELPRIPGVTPFAVAMEKGHHRLADFLIECGAQVPNFSESDSIALDLNTFQERLERAIENCWQGMRREFPMETFCMFAIETDDDCVVINGILDSYEAIERDKGHASRRGYRPQADSRIGQVLFDSNNEFYLETDRYFSELSKELNSVLDMNEPVTNTKRRKKRLTAIFESALRNCDNRGVFCESSRREELLILVAFMDPDKSQRKLMNSIVKRLNPKQVVMQYLGSFGN